MAALLSAAHVTHSTNIPACSAPRTVTRLGVLRVVAAKKDDKPDAVRPGGAPKKPESKGPGMAPMYMETIEQRKAAKAFRKGGADDGGGGGGGGGDDDDGGWWNGGGGDEVNPLGVGICLAAAVAAYFYYKKEKERQEEAKEAFRQAMIEKQERMRQKMLAKKKKLRTAASGTGVGTAAGPSVGAAAA